MQYFLLASCLSTTLSRTHDQRSWEVWFIRLNSKKFELFQRALFKFSIFSFNKCLNGMAKSNSHIEKNCLYPACFNSLFLLFIWRLMFQLNPQKGSFLFFSEVLAVWHKCPTIISLPIESANGLECGGRKKTWISSFVWLLASLWAVIRLKSDSTV